MTILAILNLHLFSWDTDIYEWMSSLHRLEGRNQCEVTHLAWLGLKMQEPASPVVLLKIDFTNDYEIQRIIEIQKILHIHKRKGKQHLDDRSIALV